MVNLGTSHTAIVIFAVWWVCMLYLILIFQLIPTYIMQLFPLFFLDKLLNSSIGKYYDFSMYINISILNIIEVSSVSTENVELAICSLGLIYLYKECRTYYLSTYINLLLQRMQNLLFVHFVKSVSRKNVELFIFPLSSNI